MIITEHARENLAMIEGAALPSIGHMARGTLSALVASGKIGSAEVTAADRWTRDYEMAEHGVADVATAGRGIAVKLFAQERRVAAATAHRAARQAVGQAGHGRLVMALSDGLAMSAIAKSLRTVSRHDVPGMLMGDLARLAEHYTTADNKK